MKMIMLLPLRNSLFKKKNTKNSNANYHIVFLWGGKI